VGHTLASFCLLHALLSLDDLDALAMPTYTLGRGCVYVLLAVRSLTLTLSHVQYKCTYLTKRCVLSTRKADSLIASFVRESEGKVKRF
jgi:hypothetical protein